MSVLTDHQLFELLCQLVALIAGFYLASWVVTRLGRKRPGLTIGRAITAAFAVRILGALAVEQTSAARELRGPDELVWLGRAQDLAAGSISSDESIDALTSELHTFFFSLHFKVLDTVPEMMLRFEMISFAVVGAALLTAAVYELAGGRAAVVAAWLLALEPTGVFFSGLLHKEPLMFLAEGMVAFGGAVLWKRGDQRAFVPIVLGCLIATATRPYVGWFLAAAAAAVALHSALRRGAPAGRSFALAVVILALIAVFVPVVWQASSEKSLQTSLQSSQDANTADAKANLSLEQIDYSSRGKLVVNLPTRIKDVVLRPYPWELQNTSQRLGLLGTLVMFIGLILLAHALSRNGGAIMRRAAPLIYPTLFLLVAYSLSAGNAGTAFRYRTHIVGMLLCLLVVMREERTEGAAGGARRVARRPIGIAVPRTRVTSA